MQTFFRSIHAKLILWALLPNLVVIGGITLLSSLTIKNTTLDAVTRRDVVLARFAANRLAENIHKYPLFLQNLADNTIFRDQQVDKMDGLLTDKSSWLHVFDGGLFFFGDNGLALWAYPSSRLTAGAKFPDKTGFEKLQQSLRPIFSDILKPGAGGEDFIIIAVPVIGKNNRFSGAVAGICSISKSTIGTTYSKVLEYESGKSSYAFLVDGSANVLYHRRSSLIGSEISDLEAVKEVNRGSSGAIVSHNRTGEMVISGYAPVPGTSWGIVTQSDWTTIQNLIHFYTRLFLAIIWSAGLLSALIVFYFVQRLLVPVKDLTGGAAQIAAGNFIQIPVRKTKDELEVLTKQFNSMARAMEASFAATRNRIKELDKARLALCRSEERITGIINAVNDIMLMVDNHGHILWINNKGRKVFGEDAEGRDYRDVFYREQPVPDDCFVTGYFTDNSRNDTELQLLINGKYQHYWCTVNPIHWGAGGEANRVVVVCRNLTEKKRLREEVLRNAQLAALGELAAGVAHEINNPINGIINYAQIVDDHWLDKNNRHAELPQRIIKEGERIALIVSKLLSFARADTEKKEAVSIEDGVTDSLDLTGAMLKKEFIAVELDLQPQLPRCRAVRHQLLQIFLNVIGNARHALNMKYPGRNPDKKITITCSTLTGGEREMVRTVFRDNGTGIASEIIDKVCNPFFSTKLPDQGTGLGLSISHGIIEEHEGKLTVRSSAGQWTEITIDLPIWKQ
ncbi:PAS domain-containing sensor histidine kinase [Desulforhopalus singaporensis]|uniref:histidine kinase n=1 Tax=Desulforhopalus singaporensis TaxID=91360 RepID=A0A1H0KC49_9BACT|nr:PAS domain-containing sensor histidine kinase [Desulforhopalus singaporensis]SDO53494.1 PAS domain S-box-containing protein [Desulforhopalus singaporensis]